MAPQARATSDPLFPGFWSQVLQAALEAGDADGIARTVRRFQSEQKQDAAADAAKIAARRSGARGFDARKGLTAAEAQVGARQPVSVSGVAPEVICIDDKIWISVGRGFDAHQPPTAAEAQVSARQLFSAGDVK